MTEGGAPHDITEAPHRQTTGNDLTLPKTAQTPATAPTDATGPGTTGPDATGPGTTGPGTTTQADPKDAGVSIKGGRGKMLFYSGLSFLSLIALIGLVYGLDRWINSPKKFYLPGEELDPGSVPFIATASVFVLISLLVFFLLFRFRASENVRFYLALAYFVFLVIGFGMYGIAEYLRPPTRKKDPTNPESPPDPPVLPPIPPPPQPPQPPQPPPNNNQDTKPPFKPVTTPAKDSKRKTTAPAEEPKNFTVLIIAGLVGVPLILFVSIRFFRGYTKPQPSDDSNDDSNDVAVPAAPVVIAPSRRKRKGRGTQTRKKQKTKGKKTGRR